VFCNCSTAFECSRAFWNALLMLRCPCVPKHRDIALASRRVVEEAAQGLFIVFLCILFHIHPKPLIAADPTTDSFHTPCFCNSAAVCQIARSLRDHHCSSPLLHKDSRISIRCKLSPHITERWIIRDRHLSIYLCFHSSSFPFHFLFLAAFQINDRRLGTFRISNNDMIIATNGAIKEF